MKQRIKFTCETIKTSRDSGGVPETRNLTPETSTTILAKSALPAKLYVALDNSTLSGLEVAADLVYHPGGK
jgi:hypothetical protein